MYYIASAYPNSALPALSLMAIALVATGTLAIWLALVFIAAREPRKPAAGLSRELKGALVPEPRSEEFAVSDEGRRRVTAPGGERDKQSALETSGASRAPEGERGKQSERENRAA